MIETDEVIVLGLSGGADSVCLFRVLVKLVDEYKKEDKRISLKAVHVNHMIRKTAKRDEDFVRRLCEENDIELRVYNKDVQGYSKDEHISTEEAGRKLRYDSFYEAGQSFVKDEKGKRLTVGVAHNLNDNSETILFNMFRGSGLKGIAGIEPVSTNQQGMRIIRPLLKVTREEIEEYLKELGQEYVTDETNFSDEYTRNVIRNSILPVAKDKINSKTVENISSAGDFVAKAYEYIQSRVDTYYKECALKEDNTISIDRKRFGELEDIIKDGVIKKAMIELCGQSKDLTELHVKSVKELFEGYGNKKTNLPYKMTAWQIYDKLYIELPCDKDAHLVRNADGEKESAKCSKQMTQVVIPKEDIEEKGELEVVFMEEKYGFKLYDVDNISENDKSYIKKLINEKNCYTKCFDYGKIVGSLVLRTNQEGDYLTYTKEGSRKKLNRLFIDNKITPEERKKCTLLACDREIIWIVSVRTGCSAYVDENTKKVLVVSKL